jgi:hypothetical protein
MKFQLLEGTKFYFKVFPFLSKQSKFSAKRIFCCEVTKKSSDNTTNVTFFYEEVCVSVFLSVSVLILLWDEVVVS